MATALAPTNWGPFAQHNTCFVRWLEKVEQLCDRYLNIQFEALVLSNELDPTDDFYNNMSPEHFVQNCVVPTLELEHGADFIYEEIGEQIMWGDDPMKMNAGWEDPPGGAHGY